MRLGRPGSTPFRRYRPLPPTARAVAWLGAAEHAQIHRRWALGTATARGCATARTNAGGTPRYASFGGPDGDQVLEVLKRIRVPLIIVLHTVLSSPTAHQRYVLEATAALADVVDDDQDRAPPTARRVPGRRTQDRSHSARSVGRRSSGPGAQPVRTTRRAHLGTSGPRQGCGVGNRGAAWTSGTRSGAAERRGRPDPPARTGSRR